MIRSLSNQGKSTTHLSIKSAFERKKMCDEMLSLFQKVYLVPVDVERAAEKDIYLDFHGAAPFLSYSLNSSD
jgi:N-methylhydantoinase B/oxoprolinase/acetone carboxylase alpha subunit